MKTKLVALTWVMFMLVGILTACQKGGTAQTEQESKDPAQTSATVATVPETSAKELVEITQAIAETPVILTSVGQSADVNVVETLLKKAGVKCDMETSLTADQLEGYKTLVLAVGGSSKGLGAAGIDANQELERVKQVITKAKEEKIVILALHVGGSPRRGVLSDSFVPDSLEAANGAIIVSEGDEDGFMRGIVTEYGIPTVFVDDPVGAIEPIKLIFGKK